MNTTSGTRWQVRETRQIEYELINVEDIFDPHNDALLSMGRVHGGRRFVVVDEIVFRHHGMRLHTYLAQHKIGAHIVPFPGGEVGKTMDAWQGLLRELDRFPIHRRDEPIIAIGGGVLTDVVGFVASSYRRGVPHIKVPTTLMGYVDASVGIKTGINFNGHKNRVGSFEPPARVLLDQDPGPVMPACLLVRGEAQHHLAVRRLLCGGPGTYDAEQHGVEVLHVHRTTSPDLTVADLAAEGIDLPVRGLRGHDIEVPVDQQRSSSVTSAPPRDHVRTTRSTLDDRAVDADLVEEGRDVLGRLPLPRSIIGSIVGGVEADQLLTQSHHLGSGVVRRVLRCLLHGAHPAPE